MTIIPIQNEQHWHDIREKHVGGSEIQALLIDHEELALSSDDSFVTMNELYFRKKGIKEGQEASPLMAWGLVMEPLIAQMIAAENDWTIEKGQEYHEHPVHKHLGCTLDYYALETQEGPSLLQIKNVIHTSHKWTQVKATPYVEMQVQHELLVVNAAREAAGLEPFRMHCIGSMHRGNPEDIRLMFRAPNPDVQAAIVDASGRFWSDLENGREPDINSPKDYKHILDMVKSSEKLERVLDLTGKPELDETIQQWLDAKARKNAAEKEQETLKAKIMRHCVTLEPSLATYTVGRTDKHRIEIKETKVNYKAKEAYVGTQTRFDCKSVY